MLYDFQIRHPEVESNALIVDFPNFKDRIFSLNAKNRYNEFITQYEEELFHILIIFDAINHKSITADDIKCLIVFSNVIYDIQDDGKDPTDIKRAVSNKQYPYIIAICDSPKKISAYYIVVEDELISVNNKYDLDFCCVLDFVIYIYNRILVRQ